jgi:ectoine hydroxylase-related dioxygenase (phytanoyl-CoA dioxygenase family)
VSVPPSRESPTDTRRAGDAYLVTAEERARFHAEGWVHLRGVLDESELAAIEATYERFLRREIVVPGRDFCDMTGDYERPAETFAIVNVMLPRRYWPPLGDNVYERRAASIAEQLAGPDLVLDYDQLVAKPPHKDDAVFHWHQDLAYWPITADTRTASFGLALDDTRLDNGCLRFVAGSHREPGLRRHAPLLGDRDRSHTLVAAVDEARDRIVAVEIARGDVTVHHERTVHGSSGNRSAGWRRGYVVAYRARSAVEAERRLGFTHSHNDPLEVLDGVGYAVEARP